MNGTELVECSLGECLDLVLLADVGGNTNSGMTRGGQASYCGVESFSIDVCEYDLHASRGEGSGHAQAHATCRPGDYCRLAVYVVHMVAHSWSGLLKQQN